MLKSSTFNVAVFGFLLNFPWEFLQAPLFAGMAEAHHWEAVLACTRATLGDVGILLAAYSAVAVLADEWNWILRPLRWQLPLFVAIGVSVTVLVERLALSGLRPAAWSYAEQMPIVPFVDVGLSPVMQWLVVPTLVVWFVRRQLSSGQR